MLLLMLLLLVARFAEEAAGQNILQAIGRIYKSESHCCGDLGCFDVGGASLDLLKRYSSVHVNYKSVRLAMLAKLASRFIRVVNQPLNDALQTNQSTAHLRQQSQVYANDPGQHR